MADLSGRRESRDGRPQQPLAARRPSGEKGEITVLTSTVLMLLLLLLAVAGVLGWTADSRDVAYGIRPSAPAPAALPRH